MTDVTLNPVVRFIYWVLNTPGIGALVVATFGVVLMLTYSRVLRWIADGANAPEHPVYTYPTEGLRHEELHAK